MRHTLNVKEKLGNGRRVKFINILIPDRNNYFFSASIKASTKLICFVIPLYCLFVTTSCTHKENRDEYQEKGQQTGVRPWSENPNYWEYEGKPVLLLGATDNDNLFQNNNLKTHLDSLSAIGGNYVRNTMSDRDEGDLKAFHKNEEGKYDLRKWNPAYWEKFENLLKWAEEREIIIQIEIWDRFDHAREEWKTDPYNPKNNMNYTYEEANLDSLYSDHPGSNKQPFFFTVPTLQDNNVLLPIQQEFVKKLLSISLNYNNVLYCMDNETSGVEEWASYWAEFIKENSEGKEIYLTEMWDNWDLRSDTHKRTIDHPERYDFIDISQNSHKTGQENWDNAQYIFDYIRDNPRPVNSTKIYGSDHHDAWLFRGMTTRHAVNTFFRNILGGFASSRFHRPPHGLGLSKWPIQSIKTIRKVEEKVKMWELEPMLELLTDREDNEAFLAGRTGDKYLIFFPGDGDVKLNLSEYATRFELSWITIEESEWGNAVEMEGGDWVSLTPPVGTGCLALVQAK